MVVLGGLKFLMSEVPLYCFPRAEKIHLMGKDKLSCTRGALSTLMTTLQGFLAHKKTPNPLGTP